MRYLKVTLLFGTLVSLAVWALHEAGAFSLGNIYLASYLGHEPTVTAGPIQYALVLALAFSIAWTTIDIGPSTLKVGIATAAMAQILSATALAHLFGQFFSPFAALSSVFLSFTIAYAYSQTSAGLRKQVLQSQFGTRISKATFSKLLNSNEPLNFGGQTREASIVVCEIANRQILLESLPTCDFVTIHNAFLQNAAELLIQNGAYLDECNGERVRVVFGTPLPSQDHAIAACKAALALVDRLNCVNQECAAIWSRTLDFRIGINSGEVLAANFGSDSAHHFSVTGEAVDFAHQLWAANKLYGSRLLMSASTFMKVEGAFEVRPMELIQRCPEDPVLEEVYEPLCAPGDFTQEQGQRRDAFWKGVICCRQGLWADASGYFKHALPSQGHDGPVQFYLNRVEHARREQPLLATHVSAWLTHS